MSICVLFFGWFFITIIEQHTQACYVCFNWVYKLLVFFLQKWPFCCVKMLRCLVVRSRANNSGLAQGCPLQGLLVYSVGIFLFHFPLRALKRNFFVNTLHNLIAVFSFFHFLIAAYFLSLTTAAQWADIFIKLSTLMPQSFCWKVTINSKPICVYK